MTQMTSASLTSVSVRRRARLSGNPIWRSLKNARITGLRGFPRDFTQCPALLRCCSQLSASPTLSTFRPGASSRHIASASTERTRLFEQTKIQYISSTFIAEIGPPGEQEVEFDELPVDCR